MSRVHIGSSSELVLHLLDGEEVSVLVHDEVALLRVGLGEEVGAGLAEQDQQLMENREDNTDQ